MKTKSISLFIILLILSLSCSPSLVSAYEYKIPTTLSEEEYQKRLQNYIDTPDELKIYVDDIVHPEEEVDFMTIYDAAHAVNIPKNKKDSSANNPPIAKNANSVIYTTTLQLCDYDNINQVEAVKDFFKPYNLVPYQYMDLMNYAQTAKNIKYFANNYLNIYIDSHQNAAGMIGLEPYGYINIEGKEMTNIAFFTRLDEAKITYDGYFFSEARPNYAEFKVSVDSVAKIINNNFYKIGNYQELNIINGRLNAQGRPEFNQPTQQYRSANPTLDILIPKKHPIAQFVKENIPPAAEYLKPIETRPINAANQPYDISPDTIRDNYVYNGVDPENAHTIFRQRYSETFFDKMNYCESTSMFLVAIVILILAWVYK
jgi:hypothetical protein